MSKRTLIRAAKERRRSSPPLSPAAVWTAECGAFTAFVYPTTRKLLVCVHFGARAVLFYEIDPLQLGKVTRAAAKALIAERTKKPVRNRHLPIFNFRKL